MKPIDIQNAVLLKMAALSPATIPQLRRRLAPANANFTFRSVTSAVLRLQRQGLVAQVSEEIVGIEAHPIFGLTVAGKDEARRINHIEALA